MSDQFIFSLGKALLLLGACLEIRHLLAAIGGRFEGCERIADVFSRIARFDDVAMVGIGTCLVLMAAVVVSIYGEFFSGVSPRL